LFFLALFGPFSAIAPDKLETDATGSGSAFLQAGVSDEGFSAKLWEDDFSGDWVSRWPLRWVENNALHRTNTFEQDGETWLRVTYPEGQVGRGFKFMTDFGPQERMFLEYKVRFADDFDWVHGGKLPGFAGGRVKAGVKPDGTDGWLSRVMWLEGGTGIAYVYHPDMPGKWGENIRFKGGQFQRGVTHTIGIELAMNTPGEHDGALRTWLDGVLVVERTDMRWRDIPELAIDGFVFSTFFGGGTPEWAPTKEEHIDFGDFKLFPAPPWEGEEQSAVDPL
jgi:hypothetical protein